MAPAPKRRKLSPEASEGSSAASGFDSADEHANNVDTPGTESDAAALESLHDDEVSADQNVESDPHEASDEGDDDDESKADEPEQTLVEAAQTAGTKPKSNGDKSSERPQQRPRPAAQLMSFISMTGGGADATLFQARSEDFLARLRPQRTAVAESAEACLHDLKQVFESLPAKEPVTVVQAEREMIRKNGVAIPFPEPRPLHDAQYKLEFSKPASINVIGSYPLSLGLRDDPVLAIDMMVQLPDALFQEKDYQNHRYFYRRAYYLACLVSGLQRARAGKYSVKFESHHGNPLHPIAVVSTADAGTYKWRVNIIPSISQKVFNVDRLIPTKCSIKTQKSESIEGSPTAFYNSSIQSDRLANAYLKLLHSASSSCDAFKDACILIKAWLRTRGLSGSLQAGGFGRFEGSVVVAALLSAGDLSPRYSSHQLFKALLQFLAAKDMLKSAVSIGQSLGKEIEVADCPMLFDQARSHNIAYKMTPWSARMLRTAARSSLQMLGHLSMDVFELAFTVQEDVLHLKYDLALAIPKRLLVPSGDMSDHEALSSHQKLYDVLRRGLNDRVTLVDLRLDPLTSWDVASARPSWATKGEVVIALRLNPATASRTVDHGPPASDKQAAQAYREFWGEKAELRRFKDGSIMESVVWSGKLDTQSLTVEIVSHVIGRHFGAASIAGIKVLGGNAAKLISKPDGLAAFQVVMEAFKSLESDIRALDELPLAIRQVAVADPQARFASVELPSAMSPPVDVVVQFESSTRWPDDPRAVQRVKAAFLLKMSSLLQSSNNAITSKVGLENTDSPTLNQAFLDIDYPTGTTFRLRIHHERELSLIQKLLKDKATSPPDRDAATTALAHYKRTFTATPAHTASMARLSTRFPALSPTVRLLKSWFAAHHLTSHFPAPLIELLAAHAFLSPAPYPPPGSARTALLRALAHLARWDWRADPIVVPDAVDAEHRAATDRTARARFAAWRRLDPAMHRVAAFVASAADAEGAVWSDVAHGGARVVAAARMSALAGAAVEVVRDVEGFDVRALFVSDVGDFDFVVGLAKAKGTTGGFKNLELARDGDGGVDAVAAYVDELQRVYGQAVVLFYGGKGAGVVAGLWNPVVERRAWKVNLGYSSVPEVGADGQVEAVVNKDAILAEMARLGGDLVAKIEKHSH